MHATRLIAAEGPYGEVVLRRRETPDGVIDELIVNGVFAMDSHDPTSERALADLPIPLDSARVLLGGLGLGYTAAALLDGGAGHVDVVELQPALVEWARRRLTPTLGRVADDPRAHLIVADVADVLGADDAGPWDAILLDVDNGPDFLIHDDNARLYSAAGLRRARQRLRVGGVLAIWCQGPSAELRDGMVAQGRTTMKHHRTQRGERAWSYVIYTLTAG